MHKFMLALAAAVGIGAALSPAPAAALTFDLDLYAHPTSIHECGSCSEKTWDHGKSCWNCTGSTCNCILGGFTITPPGGEPHTYDGQWWPGVRI